MDGNWKVVRGEDMMVQLCEVTCQSAGCVMSGLPNKLYVVVNDDGSHNVMCGGCSVVFSQESITKVSPPVDSESYNPNVAEA
jgi:hypothetical protein